MKHWYGSLIAICVIGLIPRALSVHWNSIEHGDIQGDAAAAASMITDGRLLASEENLLVAHPPVWALLGAGVLAITQWEPTPAHAFIALKWLSFVSGMLVIIGSALLARSRFGETEALLIALWLAGSYLMIDYSGNGALYSLQTLTYLIWIAVAYRQPRFAPVLLGVASGAGYLVNHQSMVLAAASVIVLLCTSRTWLQKGGDIVVVTVVTFLVTLPWLLRNYIVFGDLFYSHAVNSTYIYVKTAIPRDIEIGTAERMKILHNVLTSWLPNNLYYMARKLCILAPIAFFFFSFAWIDYLFSRERLKYMLPILTLCAFHILLSASWPVTKFRYFVPLLPLVFFIGMDQIMHLSMGRTIRIGIFAVITASIVVLSYLTYSSVPTHTYYYDGAITNDPFHARGEYDFMVEKGLIPSLAQ